MSRYQSYLDCKESCLPLIGRIPTHWVLTKLKFIGVLKGGAGFPHEEQGNTSEAIDFHKVNALAKASDEGFIEKSENTVSRETAKRLGAFVFPKKSIVFAKVGAALLLSRIRMLKESACIDNNLMGFVVHRQYDVDFIKYAMELIRFDLLVNPGAIPSLNENQIGNYFLVVPTYAEQQKIANFLRHETAKIDTLIAKQQELIKLLKEKRQAVISHAVTKGLNPNAPMRNSGVEWLGEVPAHWVVAQLKFNTLEMQTGPFGSQLHAEDYIDDGIPLVNPAHMVDGKIVPDSQVTVDNDTCDRLSRHKLKAGDIVFARRGDLGRCAIVTEVEEGWLCGTGSLKAKLNKRLLPEYSYLLITSNGVISELSLESKGSTMENLNTETLGRVRLPVPPVGEQDEILKYVKDVSGRYSILIDDASRGIKLMQERRTALISAAVTGKIDVRDWQPPSESAIAA